MEALGRRRRVEGFVAEGRKNAGAVGEVWVKWGELAAEEESAWLTTCQPRDIKRQNDGSLE